MGENSRKSKYQIIIKDGKPDCDDFDSDLLEKGIEFSDFVAIVEDGYSVEEMINGILDHEWKWNYFDSKEKSRVSSLLTHFSDNRMEFKSIKNKTDLQIKTLEQLEKAYKRLIFKAEKEGFLEVGEKDFLLSQDK